MKNMEKHISNTFTLGDLTARYIIEENGRPVLDLIPTSKLGDVVELKKSNGDCLVQCKLIGDQYPTGYSGGVTLRNSGTVDHMHLVKQDVRKFADEISGKPRTEIDTILADDAHHTWIHTLGYTEGEACVDSKTTFINGELGELGDGSQVSGPGDGSLGLGDGSLVRDIIPAPGDASLEMLSSFSLSNMTPFSEGESHNKVKIHRIRSKWSDEGWLVSETAESLQLEPAWAYWPAKSIRYGQIGTMPVRTFAPFGALEDTEAGVVWAASLAIESSWQMELYRRDAGFNFSGGLADREFGHWMKTIAPGESFTTPTAILTASTRGVDDACQRLTSWNRKFLALNPASEESLPVMFNEYCTTWGTPSEKNITGILDAIDGHGIEYFVVDCGWFLEDGKDWGNSMGDYIPSDTLFPNGLSAVTKKIHDKGMKAGIWFEIDNIGKFAHIYNQEELLLKRDGLVLETQNRRFFDMRKPEVKAYLTERVNGTLKKYGFEYIKMDYNDTYGLGCDGAESLGEGLRQDREASLEFIRNLKKDIPDLIIENCASGGHKTEPLMMSLVSQASFSDAHECTNIPVIAAALHRTILPRQSQIWCVIRKTDSLKRLAYSVAATFLGRLCFSGDVTELSKEQWAKLDEGIAFYKQIVPAIKDGYTWFFGDRGPSARKLEGWQGILRQGGGVTYLTVHVFDNAPRSFTIDLPEEVAASLKEGIVGEYKGSGISATLSGSTLTVTRDEDMEALALILR